MFSSPRAKQWKWFGIAVVLMAVLGLAQRQLGQSAEQRAMRSPDDAAAKAPPGMVALNVLPGGLNSLFVSYQWMRSQAMVQEGRFYDALQRAEWICAMQPKFPGVWDFQAHNMAWNIAVQTYTPRERWRWIYNGIKLLRDEGIPQNPRSLLLYRELSWIFFQKVGGNLDEMHMSYKSRWAGEMQRLLGAPPPGPTDEVIAAFEPITKAPLNYSIRPDAETPIQKSSLDVLENDRGVAEYLAALRAVGLEANRSLLDAYNAWSTDDAVASTRIYPPQPVTERDKMLSAILNDRAYSQARAQLLAFVRAQLLWNEYKMDPRMMLELMTRYRLPLDWRFAQVHGLYWADYGLKVAVGAERSDFEALNTRRNFLNALKDMTWYGRMGYVQNIDDADYPHITFGADWRYVMPIHEEFVRVAEEASKARGETFDQSSFKDSHRNYLSDSMSLLYTLGQGAKAQELFEWAKKAYFPNQPSDDWNFVHVRDFIINRFRLDTVPSSSVAAAQINASLNTAFVSLANNDMETHRDMLDYATRLYKVFQGKVAQRVRLPAFEDIAAQVAQQLLVEPRAAGYMDLYSVKDRSRLYQAILSAWPEIALRVYDEITMPLKAECLAAGIQFERAFPPPSGLEEYRKKHAAEAPIISPG